MAASSLYAANLEPYLSNWPFVLAGLGVALLVYLVMMLRQTWSLQRPPTPPLPYLGPEEELHDSVWQLEAQPFSDRRKTVRRAGHPVRVLVTSPAFKHHIQSAYVLDRSTGGLRLALPIAVATGITLQVRADDAPDSTSWVTVTVRNCRNAGQHFELGCEFDKTPPWSVLLLFG